MERVLANGMRYRFEELWSGYINTYCFYGGKWNALAMDFFHSWDEVNAWCEKMDDKYLHPQEWKPSAPPKDYYDDTTRYYGD